MSITVMASARLIVKEAEMIRVRTKRTTPNLLLQRNPKQTTLLFSRLLLMNLIARVSKLDIRVPQLQPHLHLAPRLDFHLRTMATTKVMAKVMAATATTKVTVKVMVAMAATKVMANEVTTVTMATIEAMANEEAMVVMATTTGVKVAATMATTKAIAKVVVAMVNNAANAERKLKVRSWFTRPPVRTC
jgi:hypothetical protein